MGKEKIKRPGLFPNGLTANKTMTCSSGLTVGGTATINTLSVSSGATLGGAATATTSFAASLGVTLPRTLASSSANLPAYGLITIAGTSAMACVIGAPVAGKEVAIYKTANSTAIASITTNATGSVTLDGTNVTLTFNGQNQWIRLMGDSSTRWLMLGTTATFGGLS